MAGWLAGAGRPAGRNPPPSPLAGAAPNRSKYLHSHVWLMSVRVRYQQSTLSIKHILLPAFVAFLAFPV